VDILVEIDGYFYIHAGVPEILFIYADVWRALINEVVEFFAIDMEVDRERDVVHDGFDRHHKIPTRNKRVCIPVAFYITPDVQDTHLGVLLSLTPRELERALVRDLKRNEFINTVHDACDRISEVLDCLAVAFFLLFFKNNTLVYIPALDADNRPRFNIIDGQLFRIVLLTPALLLLDNIRCNW